MKRTAAFKKKITNFLYDHYHLKEGLSITWATILTTLGALFYAFAFVSFVTPATPSDYTIVTGGVGGIAQNIALIVQMNGVDLSAEDLHSIFYFAMNIPILIFAFITIGKRFSILTLLNVGISSLFIFLFKEWSFCLAIREILKDNTFVRALFAGIVVGVSSGITFKADSSCGGIDVISYYFALRKSTSVGKFTFGLNSVIVTTYAILNGIHSASPATAFIGLMYSVTYLFSTALVVDAINIRNKKIRIQIISTREDIASILIANFPHGATIIKARGGYSGGDRYVVWMIVSSNEMNKVVSVCKKVDEHAFIAADSLMQVYGNFFIKPVE